MSSLMVTDPHRIPFYIAASSTVLTIDIFLAKAASQGDRLRWLPAVFTAFVISGAGILLAKYGANLGLPWQVYYSVPMIATVVTPVLVFRMKLAEAGRYVLLAFASAPLIHAAFFYSLGWTDYMPFLALPQI